MSSEPDKRTPTELVASEVGLHRMFVKAHPDLPEEELEKIELEVARRIKDRLKQ